MYVIYTHNYHKALIYERFLLISLIIHKSNRINVFKQFYIILCIVCVSCIILH
nr:MAG TPA: hypothetical protein [Caudoviricetes sp.]